MQTTTIQEKKKSVRSLFVSGKKVLVRVDYNVPIQNGAISDDTRIRESVATIEYLRKENAAVILCAHLGRPKGKANAKYSLRPASQRLSEILGKEVFFAADCIGENAQAAAVKLRAGEVLLLENLRFHSEEETNDETFARSLATLADFFVQDAFGAVHRAHASTSAVAKLLPAAAGFLLQKELDALGKVLSEPEHPFVAVLGGAKVSDKIGVIRNLLTKTDFVFVGGAMAYTFLKAQGKKMGNSLVEEDKVDLARATLDPRLVLPVDHGIADKVEPGRPAEITRGAEIPDGKIGVDIGPESSKKLAALLQNARTIFWNGPLGVFEIPEFSAGTLDCARAIAAATKNGAFSVVGGGDSVAALNQSGLAKSVSHISTGGGASLEFVEGKKLPGIEAIPNE